MSVIDSSTEKKITGGNCSSHLLFLTCTCDTSCPHTSLSILVGVILEIASISQSKNRLFSGHLKMIIEPTNGDDPDTQPASGRPILLLL